MNTKSLLITAFEELIYLEELCLTEAFANRDYFTIEKSAGHLRLLIDQKKIIESENQKDIA